MIEFKLIKRLFSLLILLILGTVLQACTRTSDSIKQGEKSFVEINGQLSVENGKLVNQHGEPLALHGVSLGWHNWWPRFYNAGTVRWLADDWQATVIRAAIGVEPYDSFLENPDKAYHLLYKVIDAAIAGGIYVIVDWHSHSIQTEAAKEFFTTVANKYKGYPNIIYELYNEPEYDSWAEVKAYSIELIETIRRINPDNIILVGNPHWDQDIHLVADDPIHGFDNIMYTVHFYAATHGQFLRDRTQYALDKGIPVFVSECAATQASGSDSFDMDEWARWVRFMDKNRMSYVMWSIADKDELCSMILDESSPASHWKEKDLKFWGVEVRRLLREK